MSQAPLKCEACGYDQVPYYIRDDPNKPILCISCRMSKSRQHKFDQAKTYVEIFKDLQVKDNSITIPIEHPDLINDLNDMTTRFIRFLKVSYIQYRVEKLFETHEYTPVAAGVVRENLKDLKVRILLRDITSLQKITPKMQDQVVMGESVILYVEEPKSYIKKANIFCDRDRCGASYFVTADKDYKITYPRICTQCQQGRLAMDETSLEFDWMQYIFLEELPDQAKKNSPRKFTARIVGDLVGDALIGQRKRFVGVPKTIVEDDEEESHQFIIDVISFTDMDDERPPEIDVDEILKIQNRSETDEKYLDWLCASYAPHIKHRDLEKLAILLAITSGSQTGFDQRTRSHTLIVGDAGQGKSELGKFTKKVIVKGDIVDGTALSKAGLVFGLDKMANGQQVPTAGAAVLNNGGVLIIDEFDKATNERKSLHSVLEQGIAIFDKIKKAKAPAVITMVALANPKYLKWKEGSDTMENLEHIETTLLDRCDTIVRMLPVKDVEKSKKQLESFIDGVNNEPVDPDLLTVQQYKSFIYYIRKINPKINPEAKEKILQFYGDMQSIEQPEGSLPMEQRQGEGIVRLCTSMARLFFKDIIDCDIVDRTIEFYKRTLNTLGMNTDKGVHQMAMENFHLNREESFWHAVKLVDKDENGYFEGSAVIKLLRESAHFKDDDAAEDYLYNVMWDKLHKITMKGGKFKKI